MPKWLPKPTAEPVIERVEVLRRQCRIGLRIVARTGLSLATVIRIMRRMKLSRIRELELQLPAQRNEHNAPDDLLHLDIKRLGRFHAEGHRIHVDMSRKTRCVDWEYVNVAIDDCVVSTGCSDREASG